MLYSRQTSTCIPSLPSHVPLIIFRHSTIYQCDNPASTINYPLVVRGVNQGDYPIAREAQDGGKLPLRERHRYIVENLYRYHDAIAYLRQIVGFNFVRLQIVD